MNQELYERLSSYLREKGIAAASFSCCHRYDCQRDVESCHGRFTPATDTEVGYRYGSVQPRIVHVSIDPPTGGAVEDRSLPREGTAYFRRPYQDGSWGHWYWLLRIVGPMMRAAGIPVKDIEAHCYIAHTRAARCSANLEKGRQGPYSLSVRCAYCLPWELQILAPDLVLSMGNAAHEAIERTHEWRNIDGNDLRRLKVGVFEIDWIAMPHPTSWGKFHKLRNERQTRYCQVAASAI